MTRKRSAARGSSTGSAGTTQKTKRRVGVRTHGGDGALHVSMDTMRGARAKAAEHVHADRARASGERRSASTADVEHHAHTRGLLDDARELFSIVRRGGQKLFAAGIDWRVLATLPRRVEIVDKARRAWDRQRSRTTPAALHRAREEAAQLKTELLAAGRYVLRHDAAAQKRLDVIASGKGIENLVRDLRALADFWSRRSSQLTRTELPTDVVRRARTIAAQLDLAQHGAQEAMATGSGAVHATSPLALLERAVHELQNAFRDAPERLALFRYEFAREKPTVPRTRTTRRFSE